MRYMTHNPAYFDTEVAEKLFKPIYPVVAQAILERTQQRTGDVLDFGCGGGHLGIEVYKQGAFSSLSFFDVENEALRRAHDRALAEGIKTATYQGDACTLVPSQAIGKTYDLIVSRGSMPFWDDQKAAFTNIAGLLNPGGVAYIGGGMGNAQLAAQIKEQMRQIREAQGGEGPRLFDRSRSKSLASEAYVELLEGLGLKCTVFASEDEGRWIMFRRPAAL